MITLVILLVILLIIAGIFGYIQLISRMNNEKMLMETFNRIAKALIIMRDLDRSGAFQAHDQVGQTFLLLTLALEQLYNYFSIDKEETETSE